MPNYATTDVYGTHPVTGVRILIARAGSPIPEEFDDLVAGGSKTATPPEADVARTGRETTLNENVPAVAAAADGDLLIGEVPFNATVVAISYTPEANVTGHNTESRTLTIVNKGQSGSGTTVIGTLAFTAGNNGVAFDEKSYVLSTTVANRDVAAGDQLVAVSTHVGSTGLADPGGRVQVELVER